eukprot:UN1578
MRRPVLFGKVVAAPSTQRAIQKQHLEQIKQNLADTVASSHRPKELYETLKARIGAGDKWALRVAKDGWRDLLDNVRVVQSNQNVKSALVLGCAVAMGFSPLEIAEHANDTWTEYRDFFGHLYHIGMICASMFGLLTIVMSSSWMNWSYVFIMDADDALWFLRFLRPELTDIMAACQLLTLASGAPFGAVAQYGEPTASVSFYSAWFIIGIGSLWYYGLLLVQNVRDLVRHRTHKSEYLGMLRDDFQAFESEVLCATPECAVIGATDRNSAQDLLGMRPHTGSACSESAIGATDRNGAQDL